MNIEQRFYSCRRCAFSLIEMLVYISVLAVLMGCGYAALYRCIDSSTALRRNAEDIARTIRAGENWRADIRAATRVTLETDEPTAVLRVEGSDHTIRFRISGKVLSRQLEDGDWQPVLDNVKSSWFFKEQRGDIDAWRWELELEPRRKRLHNMTPLFTFLAAPKPESTQ
jgi:type II secretory pathway pseudopilin PulG